MPDRRKYVDVWTERETKRFARHLRICGWVNSAIGLGLGTMVLSLMNDLEPRMSPFKITLLLLLPSLQLAGVGLALGHRWPRYVLWPLSVTWVLAFPFGTPLGLYNVWVLYNTRDRANAVRK